MSALPEPIPGAVPPAAKKAAKAAPKPRGIRQTMSDLHIWTGLLVGWILYAMFLTGTVSYFREEISQWMRPALPAMHGAPDAAEVSERVAAAMARLAPSAPQWSIGMPDSRTNTANAFWRGEGRRFERANFVPATGERLKVSETLGGDFFFRFHFDLHYLPVIWARWIVGFCAMFMLVAIVSGIITHKKIFTDFFTFRRGKGQRSWLDAHGALSVLGLPFHLMITYTGLVTLMLMYMPWGAQTAFENQKARAALSSEMSSFVPAGKPSGQAAPLAPLGPMVRQAQERWGAEGVGRVTINNPGDANARVVVVRSDSTRVSVSPQYMLFDGTDGRVVEVKDKVGGAAETRSVLYGLHMGRFGDLTLRWLYFIVSLGGTAMVGTGLVLWTVKRRAQLPDPSRPYFGFRLVERLNIAAIAGLSIGMTAMLWANRLLPDDLAGRGQREVDVMFAVWGLSLAWAVLRPARRAWIELLWAGAAALALLPVLNIFTTDRPLWTSIARGETVFVAMQLGFLALAALHAALAIGVTRHKPKVKPVRAPRASAASAAKEVAA